MKSNLKYLQLIAGIFIFSCFFSNSYSQNSVVSSHFFTGIHQADSLLINAPINYEADYCVVWNLGKDYENDQSAWIKKAEIVSFLGKRDFKVFENDGFTYYAFGNLARLALKKDFNSNKIYCKQDKYMDSILVNFPSDASMHIIVSGFEYKQVEENDLSKYLSIKNFKIICYKNAVFYVITPFYKDEKPSFILPEQSK